MRAWNRELSAIIGAAASAYKTGTLPAPTVNKISDAAVKLTDRLAPAIFTGFGGPAPLPARSVNWTAVATEATKLQDACG